MEDHVNFQFPAQGMKLQDDRTQRSISPLSRTSSVLGGRNEDHRRIEEHKQHQIEITTPPDHQSILEQSENYEELDMPTGKGSEHTRAMGRWSRLPTDWWIWELLALLCSVISLVAIVLVLRLHEGRPVPDWPFSITINSLLSIFATIMSATMLVPIAEGIGQGKWHWFQQYHALRDMEVYDQASRGPWGALKMLWGIRWRHVSSLGALITVLALAVGPFVQQATSFQLEQVASSQNSTLPVRLTFANDWSAFYKGVVYDGLFGFGNSTLIPDCPSGNCSWLSYQTLAVCSRCVNVTGLVSYLQLNEQVQSCDPYHTSCRWTLPNGLALGNSFEVGHNSTMINTSGTLPPMMLDKVGYAIANFSLLARRDEYGPWATECSLYWCVNTYTATATNTIFNENFHNSWSNATLTKHDNGYFGTTVYNITPPTGSAKSQPNVRLSNTTMDYYRSTINSQGYYLVGADHTFGAWLGPLLSGNSTPYSDPAFSSDVVELFNYDTRQVPVIFARLAQCLTIAIRTAEDLEDNPWMAQALGVTWMSETMVRVQWAWLSLPCALLLASFVFLRVTAVGTARGKLGIWKSSTLALLFHGLGARDGDWVEGSGHLVGMKETAERMRVRLVDEGNGGGVLVEGYDLGGRGGGGLGWKWGAGEK